MASTTNEEWSSSAPQPKAPKSKMVWWIVGCGGAFVFVILVGLLATLVMPNVRSALSKAQMAKAKVDLEEIRTELGAYALAHDGTYPATLAELSRSRSPARTPWIDPWGRPFQLAPASEPGQFPRVFSLGADGVQGGEGANSDVELR